MKKQDDNSLKQVFVKVFCLAMIFLSCLSCKKLVDAGPPKTLIGNSDAFKNVTGATSALVGIYASLEGYNNVNTSLLPGLSADELTSYSAPISRYYTNSLNAAVNDDFWSNFYSYIFQVNNIIEQVSASAGIKEDDKHKLIAEASFLRAFLHFYLLNYYGDIPYITSTDYAANSNVSRMSAKDEVYPMIIKDLKTAEAGLSAEYLSGKRVRINKSVATAMLARVFLYTGDWQNAKTYATTVIENPDYDLETLENVFLQSSKEAIWQLSPNVPAFPYAAEAQKFILTTAPSQSSGKVSLSPLLLDAFEAGDLRKKQWVGTFTAGPTNYAYAFKYKSTANVPLEYSIVMRLAEQYLIRAEANAQLDHIPEAVQDLNLLRERAAIDLYPEDLAKPACLDAVAKERRIELFTEWGHRWLDLKRTGKIDEVMPAVARAKGGIWKSEWQLYPIPQAQMSTAPKFAGKQNPGY